MGDNLITAYEELCKSYHNIDEFRSKLLAALPAATAAGILFAAKENLGLLKNHPMAIGTFGLVIALGLFTYELYGIKKCAALIGKGKQLERLLEFEGQFTTRPHALLGIIDEPLAAALIYPAVVASWVFLILYRKPVTQISLWVTGCVFVGLGAAVVAWDWRLARTRPETCHACRNEFQRSRGARIRIGSASALRDYWLCDRCEKQLVAWFSAGGSRAVAGFGGTHGALRTAEPPGVADAKPRESSVST